MRKWEGLEVKACTWSMELAVGGIPFVRRDLEQAYRLLRLGTGCSMDWMGSPRTNGGWDSVSPRSEMFQEPLTTSMLHCDINQLNLQ